MAQPPDVLTVPSTSPLPGTVLQTHDLIEIYAQRAAVDHVNLARISILLSWQISRAKRHVGNQSYILVWRRASSMRYAPPVPPAFADLTEREVEILRLIAARDANAIIAARTQATLFAWQ